jgi:hypothetical protein
VNPVLVRKLRSSKIKDNATPPAGLAR